MKAYIDSSVVLRALLNEKNQFRDWVDIKVATSSKLLEVECHRTIERYRLEGEIDDLAVSELKSALNAFLRGVTLFSIDSSILSRAAEPFPTVVGSLDAIHLSTAMKWNRQEGSIVMVSHDEQLRIAARAVNLEVAPS